MRVRFRWFAIAAVVSGLIGYPGVAQAQFFGAPMGGGWGGWGGGYYGCGYAPFFGTTPYGDALYGSAALTAAAGQATLYSSMAAVNAQEAYGQWIENRKLAAQNSIDISKMVASYRAENRTRPPTPEQVVGFNKSRLPDRLAPDQLDQKAGHIKWPALLMGEEFAADRTALEASFVERVTRPYASGLGTKNYHDVLHAAANMHHTLHGLLGAITSDEFIAANKFISSLTYEARFEPDTSVAQP
ncbi:MAG TPA: hypothetical protein VFW87_11730 [Pirellulales bacterium]|nr:hypothetical protein [Pirellulales bacterium]